MALSIHVGLQSLTDIDVRRMTGSEALSGYSTIQLELVAKGDTPLLHEEVDAVLSDVMAIGMDPTDDMPAAFWHGWPRALTYVPSGKKGVLRYNLEFGSLDWRSMLFRRSRVFQDMSVPDIVRQITNEAGCACNNRTTNKYPPREYTVQYEETDRDFVQRLLEHEGIFHYYDVNLSERVLADDNSVFQHAEGFEIVKLVARLEGAPGITELSWDHQLVSSHAAVRDYDWRTPNTLVQADQEVGAHGYGLHVYFGEHIKGSDAKRLATVRAQELASPHQVIRATSNIPCLRPGHRFTIEAPEHAGPELDGLEVVVASVRHDILQSTFEDRGSAPRPYRNTLELFPYSVPYRPQRTTPKPRIDGVVYAIIDGETASTAAPLDDQGQYRVFFPFDTNAKAGGRASRWVRMAQPYAGAGYGMHFPLHIGTQVLVAHVNGDPDRPVIVGAIPNAATTSPVASANSTQSAIRSHNGILFEFEDDA